MAPRVMAPRMVSRRALLALAALSAWAPSAHAGKKKRAPAPYDATVLRDHGGKLTSLRQAAASRRLVVVVLKGTWCDVCVGQLERLAQLKEQLERLGTTVVGLTTDSHEKAAKLAADRGLPFAVLSDPSHRVIDALGLWRPQWGHPLPAVVIFDRCGEQRGRILGRGPGERPEQAIVDFLKKLQKNPERCSLPSA